MRSFKRGLIVVLENAYLETAKIGSEYMLLNSDDHVAFLTKKKRDPSHARPDIVHQCLMSLLDSPLSKAGLLKVFVRTHNNVVIDINPKLRIPRTFKRFAGLMVQLLHKLSIKAEGERGEPVLKLVKGPVSQYFPYGSRCIGTTYSTPNLVDIFDFVPTLFANAKKEKEEEEETKEPKLKKIKVEVKDEDEDEVQEVKVKGNKGFKLEEEDEEEDKESDSEEDEEEEESDKEEEQVDEIPQNFEVKDNLDFTDGSHEDDKVFVFVVGAMSHGKINVDYTQEDVKISDYPLSGSVACVKICSAFERYFKIV